MLCCPEAVVSPFNQHCPGFGHSVVRNSGPSRGSGDDFTVVVLYLNFRPPPGLGSSGSGSLILDSM